MKYNETKTNRSPLICERAAARRLGTGLQRQSILKFIHWFSSSWWRRVVLAGDGGEAEEVLPTLRREAEPAVT